VPSAKTTERIAIRAARPADARAVRALCDRIWRDDYVPEIFREWVRDRRGRLWVATVDGKVAGVAKLSLVGDHEAWLHGLRVDPRFRRRGLATALARHRLERARRLGARVARMDTAQDNVAVHRIARHLGFVRIGRFSFFRGRPSSAISPQRASIRSLDALWWLARHSDGIVHEEFVARKVSRTDVEKAIRRNHAFVIGEPTPRAFAIAAPIRDRLRVMFVAGRGRAVVDLFGSLRAIAGEADLRFVGGPLDSSRWRAAAAAGYRKPWDDAMDILERRL
jgi:ribosomal protein S18 acetylase RimI-like enzyme